MTSTKIPLLDFQNVIRYGGSNPKGWKPGRSVCYCRGRGGRPL